MIGTRYIRVRVFWATAVHVMTDDVWKRDAEASTFTLDDQIEDFVERERVEIQGTSSPSSTLFMDGANRCDRTGIAVWYVKDFPDPLPDPLPEPLASEPVAPDVYKPTPAVGIPNSGEDLKL
jgi:hypothetical protein